MADLAGMAQTVECLRCGKHRGEQEDECPRCGYLGWARPAELDEATRRMLRRRPPEARRLRSVA